MSCIFCQIVSGEVPSDILYQDEEVVAFPDINPKSPTHLLIVPKKHIPSLVELTSEDIPLVGHMVEVARQLAEKKGISRRGYRLVVNTGPEGGQAVPHLHMHLLGGRALMEDMG